LILIGIFSLYFIHTKFNIQFYLPSIKEINILFKEGWHLFLSTLSNNLYTATNTVLLGFLTNYNIVGIFSIASTISGAITKIIKIYSRVTFPYIAKFDNNKDLQVKKARLLLRLYSVILIVTGSVTFLMASTIITLIFGSNNEESILVLQILAIGIMIEPLGGFFTPYLVIKNQTKTVSKITFQTMLVNFIFVVPLIYIFQAKGMAITKIIVESFQVLLNLKYNKELIFSNQKDKS
jgi:PST family polysaccharide transporter